ncbi:MAG TPA: right-handed parallel beta-helix repeat-containing protein, partial [Humisphaera sp.]
AGNDLLRISGRSYVKVVGFEFVNNLNVSDASGIRLVGTGHHIELRSNRIHHITGDSAMGITVYGTDAAAGIHDLVVDGNEVYDCQPLESEAVTLNGNVSAFRVTNNRVHDDNNIGIDVIGHEGVCPDPAKDQARNGTVAGNRVWNCRQGGTDSAFAAGIYVDGGRDVVVERNRVWGCNIGVEVGCEHKGKTASNVTVRDNALYLNDKAGLAFGGYDASVGRVVNCRFTNNTLYRNAEATNRDQRYGQIWVQWARDCVVKSNVAYAAAGRRLAFFEAGGQSNVVLDYNVYFRPGGTGAAVTFDGDRDYETVDAYLKAKRQDPHSVFADPKFADAAGGNFDLLAGSAAINAGDPNYVPATGETDIGGGLRRLGGRVDAGADERA